MQSLNIAVVGKGQNDLAPFWEAVQSSKQVGCTTSTQKVTELTSRKVDLFVLCLNLGKEQDSCKLLIRMHKQVGKIRKIFCDARIAQVVYLGNQEDVYSQGLKQLHSGAENLGMGIATISLREEELKEEYQLKVRSLEPKVKALFEESIDGQTHPKAIHLRKHFLDIAFGFMKSKCLFTALRASLFEKLNRQSKTLEQIADEMGWSQVVAKDLLDVLTTFGILARDSKFYHNTPAASQFLVKGSQGYIGHYAIQFDKDLYELWKGLPTSLSTSKEAVIEKLDSNHPETNWVTAMESLSSCWSAVAAKLNLWSHYNHVLDVGSCRGLVSVFLGQAHKHLNFTLFDLPVSYNDTQMKPAIDALLKEHPHMEGRVQTVFGDVLKIEGLPEAEVVLLGHFLHNFGQEDKRTIIRKCVGALKPGGALVVVEYFIDKERKEHLQGLLMSLNMGVVHGNNAADYTKADLRGWLIETDQFQSFNFVDLTEEHSALIAFKK